MHNSDNFDALVSYLIDNSVVFVEFFSDVFVLIFGDNSPRERKNGNGFDDVNDVFYNHRGIVF